MVGGTGLKSPVFSFSAFPASFAMLLTPDAGSDHDLIPRGGLILKPDLIPGPHPE